MPEIERKTFHEWRLERGVKLEQLALDLNTPYPTLATIDRGMSKPRVDLAESIYLYFGVPVGSIVWGWNMRSKEGKAVPVAA